MGALGAGVTLQHRGRRDLLDEVPHGHGNRTAQEHEEVLLLVHLADDQRVGDLRHLAAVHTPVEPVNSRRLVLLVLEHLGLHVDVFTPTKRMRIVDHMEYRTYNQSQFMSLLKKVPKLEIAETYDFSYDIRNPHVVSGTTEDVVYILRKK